MRLRFAAAVAVVALGGCGGSRPATALGPGRPWHVAYNGYGHVSASVHHGRISVTLKPAQPKSPDDTHAALVLSRRSSQDTTFAVRLRTNKQLRQPHPNPWEVAWILWDYVNDHHFYYIILKPNGWELGKADPNYPGNQRFLATGSHPVFPTGHWYSIIVRQRGDVMKVSVGGHVLVRFADTQNPYPSGQVGLYTEDASATFQPHALQQPASWLPTDKGWT